MLYKEYLGQKVKLTLIDKTSYIGFLFFGKRYSGFARRYVLLPDDWTRPEVVYVVFREKQIEDNTLYDE